MNRLQATDAVHAAPDAGASTLDGGMDREHTEELAGVHVAAVRIVVSELSCHRCCAVAGSCLLCSVSVVALVVQACDNV